MPTTLELKGTCTCISCGAKHAWQRVFCIQTRAFQSEMSPFHVESHIERKSDLIQRLFCYVSQRNCKVFLISLKAIIRSSSTLYIDAGTTNFHVSRRTRTLHIRDCRLKFNSEYTTTSAYPFFIISDPIKMDDLQRTDSRARSHARYIMVNT